MALTKLKGKNLRAFIAGAAVTEEVNVSVTVNANVEDAGTKDDPGLMGNKEVTSNNWSIQVESYDATAAKLKTLISRIQNGTKVAAGFDQTNATGNNQTAANADFARAGQALLTDLSIVANNRQTIQITEQYTGTGVLA